VVEEATVKRTLGHPDGNRGLSETHLASLKAQAPSGGSGREKEEALEVGYLLTRYAYRPISVPVASGLARTPVTPNQVTYASAALSFGGGIAFARRWYVPGAALTLLGSFTDCVDAASA